MKTHPADDTDLAKQHTQDFLRFVGIVMLGAIIAIVGYVLVRLAQ